jgi:putative lipoic acid-binding regulatory protein
MNAPDGFDLLSFPCFYTFKVFGRQSDTFCAQVREVIASTAGCVPLDSVKARPSEHVKYVCVSVIARLQDRDQLERIYADLREQTEILLYL